LFAQSLRPTRFRSVSDRNPLDFIERDLVAGPVLEFCGTRAFVRGHGLSGFQRAAGFQIGRNSGGAEGMAADPARVPRSVARRWIMRQASTRFMGLSVSVPVLGAKAGFLALGWSQFCQGPPSSGRALHGALHGLFLS
jgi:hypothetical protein